MRTHVYTHTHSRSHLDYDMRARTLRDDGRMLFEVSAGCSRKKKLFHATRCSWIVVTVTESIDCFIHLMT